MLLLITIIILILLSPLIVGGFLGIIIAVIWLSGVLTAFPLSILSERDYKKKSFFRPLKHSLLYSWIYVWTFFSKKTESDNET